MAAMAHSPAPGLVVALAGLMGLVRPGLRATRLAAAAAVQAITVLLALEAQAATTATQRAAALLAIQARMLRRGLALAAVALRWATRRPPT